MCAAAFAFSSANALAIEPAHRGAFRARYLVSQTFAPRYALRALVNCTIQIAAPAVTRAAYRPGVVVAPRGSVAIQNRTGKFRNQLQFLGGPRGPCSPSLGARTSNPKTPLDFSPSLAARLLQRYHPGAASPDCGPMVPDCSQSSVCFATLGRIRGVTHGDAAAGWFAPAGAPSGHSRSNVTGRFRANSPPGSLATRSGPAITFCPA